MLTLGILLTNPALWIGALAVGVPLVVHLLTRHTRQTLIFPTIRFLIHAQASQSALHRWRHRLLLLVRTLLVALVLLAFLKPVDLNRSLAVPTAKPTRTAAIIVLDDSLSMAYSQGGASAFGRARVAVNSILEGLGSGSLANVVLARAQAEPVLPEPTDNRALLQRELAKLQPSLERAEPDLALAEALNQLRKGAAPNQPGISREIHLVADFQRSNWAALRWRDLPKEVRLVCVSVAEPDAHNNAITEVLLQPPAPTVFEEIEIVVRVANYSPAAREVPLRLRLAEGPELVRDLSIGAGHTATGTFRVRATRPGLFTGELRIPEDNLSADDRRWFSLAVTDRVRVALVSDEPASDTGSAARQLARALNPFAAGRGSLEVQRLASAELSPASLRGCSVAILAGANALTGSGRSALLEFLREGGGVLWFAGRDTDRTSLVELAAGSAGDLVLPVRWQAPIQRSATFSQANFENPILKPFQELRELGGLQFYRYAGAERVPGQGEILLRFDDRQVALATRNVGRGSLMIANFGVGLADSDCAKRTLFVPLIHQLVKGVRPQTGPARGFIVGASAAVAVPPPKTGQELRFLNPAGDRVDALVEPGAQEAVVMFPVTPRPGLYQVLVGDRPVASVAVNVDARESDLRALGSAELTELAALPREKFFAAAATDLAELQRLREGRPLWHYCLLAGLVALVLEQSLAAWWKR